QFVPSAKQQAEDRALLARHVFDDPAALRATLLQAGFKDEVADAWLAAFAQPQPLLTVDKWLAAPWSQPYRHLWLGEVDSNTQAYAAVVI
ncbi:MMPL family transporter, partial [Burkholderia sp. SIMBA_048]